MTGDEVKKALQELDHQIHDLEYELKKEYELELQKSISPYYDKIKEIQEKCQHDLQYEWTHPHNGDDYYKCKHCGISRR